MNANDSFDMPSDAEALTIGLAIATLSSRFRHGVDVIDELKTEWRGRQDLRTRLAELDKVQVSLVGAQSTVQRTYDAEYQRCGARFQIGDGAGELVDLGGDQACTDTHPCRSRTVHSLHVGGCSLLEEVTEYGY